MSAAATIPPTGAEDESLFSYGTLQLESVQLSTFGRTLKGKADALYGFKLASLSIDDPNVVAVSGKAEHPIVQYTGNPSDVVRGTVLLVTAAELGNADKYEVAAYKRVAVFLDSGRRAWAYVDSRHSGANL